MCNNIEALAQLQNGLNEIITKDWTKNRTIEEFIVESSLEISEYLECIPHKWWKGDIAKTLPPKWWLDDKYDKRFQKSKLELVDILHFALSCGIIENEDFSIEPIYINKIKSIKSHEVYISLTTKLLSGQYVALIYELVNIANIMGFDIISFYIAKHTLNHIRQIKDTKMMGGREDNDTLLSCITTDFKVNNLFDKFIMEKNDNLVNTVYDTFDVNIVDRKTLKFYLN